MKKLILFLLIGALFQVNAQSNSFEMGYRDGYCKAKEEDKGRVPCGISPKAPMPKTDKATYQDGFSAGYKMYGGIENSNEKAQQILIQGAKDSAPEFVDVANSFNEGFNSTYTKPIKYPLGESKVEIIEPLKVDLNSFTHIAIVEVPYKTRFYYNSIAERLASSSFEILNPADKNNKIYKQKFKETSLFLKDEKNEGWLYLSIMLSKQIINGYEYNTTYTILRNSKNEIVYKAKEINTSYLQKLEFLINH